MQFTELKYITPEHESIFEETKHIPGWQMPGDSFKLYEMAYEAGDVILEIGTFGGRSATVELRGALANKRRTHPPQFFGVEIDIHGVWRSHNSLKEQGLQQYAILFHGNLEGFVQKFSIKPTMVFLDGDHRYEGVKKDLVTLSEILCANISVLCHDYENPDTPGVKKAVDEFVEEGYANFESMHGCSAFLITTDKCHGKSQTQLTHQEFLEHKVHLLEVQGRQIYESWLKSNLDCTAHLELIQKQQNQISTLEHLDDVKERIKEQISELEEDLENAYNKIKAMKTSKFWKLRTTWMQFKKGIGLQAD